MLRGLSQDELAERLAEAGLPWRLAGALERGKQDLRSAHLAGLVAALGFPERWFTDPVDELVPEVIPPEVDERYDELVALIREVLQRLER